MGALQNRLDRVAGVRVRRVRSIPLHSVLSSPTAERARVVVSDLISFVELYSYWSRTPTGPEFLIETIVAVNAGAKGSVSWDDPTTPDIKASASAFASALPELTPFLLSSPLSQPPVNFTHVVTPDRLDFGVWAAADGRTLVIGANLNNASATISVSEVLSAANISAAALGIPRMVLNGGSSIDFSFVGFGNLGSGAWIFG